MAGNRSGKRTVGKRKTPRTGASTASGTRIPVRQLAQPVFAQAEPTPDPTIFRVPHASDAPAYKLIDELNREL